MSKKSGLADSPFFTPPAAHTPPPDPPPQETADEGEMQEEERPVPAVPPDPPDGNVRPVRDVEGVRGVRPHSRQIKRHAFDIYQDQLQTLQRMKFEAMVMGIERSMAAMVREALDRFIAEENR